MNDPAPKDDAPAGDPPKDDAPPTNVFTTLGETWRADMVNAAGFEGDDATSVTNVLERVTDFPSLVKNYKQMGDKIREGNLSSALPKDATPEQVSEWREANGVPLESTGYVVPEDVKLDDAESAIFAKIFEAAHEGNVPASVMETQLKAYAEANAAIVDQRHSQDGVDSQQAEQILKDAWGPDMKANVNRIDSLLEGLPEEVRESFKEGRLSDGRAFMNSPEVMMFLGDLARKAFPGTTVVPGSDNPAQSIAEEIKKIETFMKTNEVEYRNDKDMQDRLLKLYEAEEDIGKQK